MATLEQRFWPKVAISTPSDCWEWRAGLTNAGYGQINGGGRQVKLAHRLAYEYLVGPIPEGYELDHLCRNRACCNPAHLEVVTHRENILRSPTAPTAIHARKTHCIHGHPFSGSNLRIRVRPGRNPERVCRACSSHRRHQTRTIA